MPSLVLFSSLILLLLLLLPSPSSSLSTPLPSPPSPRRFVIACQSSSSLSTGTFSPNNLLEGRVDVLARCINSALFVSNGVRHNSRITLLLGEQEMAIEVDGRTLKGCNPDEKSLALKLRETVLNDLAKAELNITTSSAHENVLSKSLLNGFTVRRGVSLKSLLEEAREGGGDVYWCSEGGDEVFDPPPFAATAAAGFASFLFVGDSKGFSGAEEEVLAEAEGVKSVRFGETSLLASSVITLAHHYLDR